MNARYGGALVAACGTILALSFLTSWRIAAGAIAAGALLLGAVATLAVCRNSATRTRWAAVGALVGTGLVAAFVVIGTLLG